MLRIRISTLNEGENQLQLLATAESLELPPDTFSDIQVDCRIHAAPQRIVVHLETTCTARLVCDRTLVEFDETLTGSYSVVFTTEDVDAEGRESGLVHFAPSEDELDLTDSVRDTILLSVPLRKVAPQAEGLDLQTSFGSSEEDTGSDPRWEVLRQLKDANR
jgi:uncharacterized protein